MSMDELLDIRYVVKNVTCRSCYRMNNWLCNKFSHYPYTGDTCNYHTNDDIYYNILLNNVYSEY